MGGGASTSSTSRTSTTRSSLPPRTNEGDAIHEDIMAHIEGEHRTTATRAMAVEHLDKVVSASLSVAAASGSGRRRGCLSLSLPTTNEGDSPAHLCATAGRADLLGDLASAYGSAVLEANDYVRIMTQVTALQTI